MGSTGLDERVIQGIRLFNEGEYYRSHDIIEEVWLEEVGETRRLLQGLIQAAVALLHAERANNRAAVKMYRASLAKLEPYAPSCCGLDLETLIDEMKTYFAPLLRAEQTPQGDPPRISGEALGDGPAAHR